MRAVTAMIAVLAVAGLFWHLQQENLPAGAREGTPEAGVLPRNTPDEPAVSVPFVASKPGPQDEADLFLIRGVIVRVEDEGLLVRCEAPQPVNVAGMVTAETGNAGAAAAARWSTGEMDGRYGELLQVENGAWRPAELNPGRTATGLILMTGAPDQASAEEGKRFQAVAASTGDLFQGRVPVFTVQFPLTKKAADSWMWKNQGPLDQGAYGN